MIIVNLYNPISFLKIIVQSFLFCFWLLCFYCHRSYCFPHQIVFASLQSHCQCEQSEFSEMNSFILIFDGEIFSRKIHEPIHFFVSFFCSLGFAMYRTNTLCPTSSCLGFFSLFDNFVYILYFLPGD